MTEVAVEDHLKLIHRVINQMGLYGDTAEEAYSQGLVAIVEAGNSYDKNKGPLANWLANNIRWSINGFLRKQKYCVSFPITIEYPREVIESTTNFNELVLEMSKRLTKIENTVLALTALGYSGVEISKKLRVSSVQITRIKIKARAKLADLL